MAKEEDKNSVSTIEELTMTYKRTHQVKQYHPDDVFLAMKISVGKNDQNKKAIENLINYGLGILQDRVDAHMPVGSVEITRHIKVTDQNGKNHEVPDRFKAPQEKESEGEGNQGDGVIGADDSPSSPQKRDLEKKAEQMAEALARCDIANAGLRVRYGEDAPIVMPDLSKDPIDIFYSCSGKAKETNEPCGSEVWDNREENIEKNKKRAKEGKNPCPDFKCQKKKCSKAVWPKRK